MLDRKKPVLGICLGAQLLAHVLGKSVHPTPDKEIGWNPIHLSDEGLNHRYTKNWLSRPVVFHWHGNTFDLPQAATLLASTEICPNQAFAIGKSILGLQFHLEMGKEHVQNLIDHSSDYREDGPFIQAPDEMIERADTAQNTRIMLYSILDEWIR